MTVSRSELLADVARALIESGLVVETGQEIPQRTRLASRARAHEIIAKDDRLHTRSRHTQTALIQDVMYTFGVSRGNARVMIGRARKLTTMPFHARENA